MSRITETYTAYNAALIDCYEFMAANPLWASQKVPETGEAFKLINRLADLAKAATETRVAYGEAVFEAYCVLTEAQEVDGLEDLRKDLLALYQMLKTQPPPELQKSTKGVGEVH